MRVADRTVAPDTRNLREMISLAGNRDRLHHRLVTIPTRFFGHLSVSFGYLNRFVESAGRKIIGMPETVRSLCVVFSKKIVGRVTVVASGNSLMAGFLPAVQLLIHHMAVRARFGPVAEIRSPLCVPKCINADAGRKADTHPKYDQFKQLQIHAGRKILLFLI